MSARQHRDELLALLALVLLTAIVLATVAVLQRDDGDGDARGAATPTPSTATPSTDPSTDPSAASSETSEPQVGRRPYVYPCQLLPTDDVQRIFGPFGAAGRVRQERLTRAATPVELRDTDARGNGGVTTRCRYTFDDAASHLLDVTVTQFASTRALVRHWSSLRARDRRSRLLAGSGDQLVVLPGRRSFALRGDLMVTEIGFTTLGEAAADVPLSPAAVASLRPRVQEAVTVLRSHLADGSATSGPRSTFLGLGSGVDGVAYVEPCSLLGDDVVEALGAPTPAPLAADSSYVGRDNFTDAQTAICERQSVERTGRRAWTTYVALELRLASDESAARAMEARHLQRRYPQGTTVTTLPTDAGTAYVVDDVGAGQDWKWRTRAVHLVVGPYEVMLSVLSHVGPGSPWGRPVGHDRLAAAVAAAAAGLPPVP